MVLLAATGLTGKTRIRKLQFGNQINLDHAILTLTETYGNLGDSAEAALEATPRQEIHGSGTFVRTPPIRQPGSGLTRLLTLSGVYTHNPGQRVKSGFNVNYAQGFPVSELPTTHPEFVLASLNGESQL